MWPETGSFSPSCVGNSGVLSFRRRCFFLLTSFFLVCTMTFEGAAAVACRRPGHGGRLSPQPAPATALQRWTLTRTDGVVRSMVGDGCHDAVQTADEWLRCHTLCSEGSGTRWARLKSVQTGLGLVAWCVALGLSPALLRPPGHFCGTANSAHPPRVHPHSQQSRLVLVFSSAAAVQSTCHNWLQNGSHCPGFV